MAASTASSADADTGRTMTGLTRVLCLGNELISDDGFGIVVARSLCDRLAREGTVATNGPAPDPALTVWSFELPESGPVELVETALTGMYLLEAVVGARQLIVVDTVVTGVTDPGTVLELREGDLDVPRGGSPHYIGILEALDLARALGLDVPSDVVIVAVEAGDFTTVGGEMTAPVAAAVPVIVERALALIRRGSTATLESSRR